MDPDDKYDRPVDYVKADRQSTCESLHIQPEKFLQRGGDCYCPRCDRWMGRSKPPEVPKKGAKR